MPRPWDLSAQDHAVIADVPEDQRALLTQQLIQSNHNCYLVAFEAAYTILGAVAVVVLVTFTHRMLNFLFHPLRLRRSRSSPLARLYLNQLLEAPLLKTRRAAPLARLRSSIIIRAPGRIHSIAILALIVTNAVGLFAFADPVPDAPESIGPPKMQYGRMLQLRAVSLLMAQLPLLFALAGRNSPIALIMGVSFNTSMLYHRWFARIVTFLAIVHGSATTWLKLQTGAATLNQAYATYPFFRWGAVAVVLFSVICFMATVPIRRFSYEFFVISHISMVAATLAAMWRHMAPQPGMSRYSDFFCYLYTAVALWAVERVWRTARVIGMNIGWTCPEMFPEQKWYECWTSRALCRSLPDGAIHVRLYLAGCLVRSSLMKVQAGNHVYVNLPFVQPFSMHPFSVITSGVETGPSPTESDLPQWPKQSRRPSEGQPYIDLAIMPQGGFTRRLATEVRASGIGSITTPAFVEGPYGRPVGPSGYDTIVLLAGGIGVTHCLSVFIEALRMQVHSHMASGSARRGHCSRTRRIELIWSMRDVRSFALVTPYLRTALVEMAAQGEPNCPARIAIKVFITSPWAGKGMRKNASLSTLATASGSAAASVPDIKLGPLSQKPSVVSFGRMSGVGWWPRPPDEAGLPQYSESTMRNSSTDLHAGPVPEQMEEVNVDVGASRTHSPAHGRSTSTNVSLVRSETETGNSFSFHMRGRSNEVRLILGADADADARGSPTGIKPELRLALTGGQPSLERDLTVLESHTQLTFVDKRPDLVSELERAIGGAEGAEGATSSVRGRVLVTSCGAPAYSDVVRNAVRSVRGSSRRAIDFHDESFSW